MDKIQENIEDIIKSSHNPFNKNSLSDSVSKCSEMIKEVAKCAFKENAQHDMGTPQDWEPMFNEWYEQFKKDYNGDKPQ